MVFIADPLLTVCSQLRYLQTLNSISQENNSTIVFPVPIDILSQMTGGLSGERKVRDEENMITSLNFYC